jgi:hypothetical protein
LSLFNLLVLADIYVTNCIECIVRIHDYGCLNYFYNLFCQHLEFRDFFFGSFIYILVF